MEFTPLAVPLICMASVVQSVMIQVQVQPHRGQVCIMTNTFINSIMGI